MNDTAANTKLDEVKMPPLWILKSVINTWAYLYRISGGRILGTFKGAPVMLLTVRRRKSGTDQTVPVLYIKVGKEFVTIGGNNGSPKHPAWYFNVSSATEVTLLVGNQTIKTRPQVIEVDSPEYLSLWKTAVAAYSGYAEYQSKTTRRLPIVKFTPV